jgi:acyl-CoA dehydrogenase
MALTIIDRAVQVHGAMGVCQDTPLASMWAHLRTLRIADGPDEAHLQQIGKNESKQRAAEIQERFARQKRTEEEYYRGMGIKKVEVGSEKFTSKL